MSCSGRYASAWQYSSMWCASSLLIGVHGGAGPADATLIDTTVDFLAAGAVGGTGQLLANTTQGTEGFITGATIDTLTATGVAWDALDAYRVSFLSTEERSTIEHYLNVAAGSIYGSLMAVNACDCTYGEGGAEFLAYINIVLARVFYDCPCTNNLSDTEKQLYSQIANDALAMIRSGEIDVCQGETGSLWPTIGFAQHGWTEFSSAAIIYKDILKNRP